MLIFILQMREPNQTLSACPTKVMKPEYEAGSVSPPKSIVLLHLEWQRAFAPPFCPAPPSRLPSLWCSGPQTVQQKKLSDQLQA